MELSDVALINVFIIIYIIFLLLNRNPVLSIFQVVADLEIIKQVLVVRTLTMSQKATEMWPVFY